MWANSWAIISRTCPGVQEPRTALGMTTSGRQTPSTSGLPSHRASANGGERRRRLLLAGNQDERQRDEDDDSQPEAKHGENGRRSRCQSAGRHHKRRRPDHDGSDLRQVLRGHVTQVHAQGGYRLRRRSDDAVGEQAGVETDHLVARGGQLGDQPFQLTGGERPFGFFPGQVGQPSKRLKALALPAGVPAMELATARHATNPKVGKIIAWLGYYTPPEGEASRSVALTLIRAVADKNPDRIARGQAVMALAWQAKQQFAEKGDNNSPEVETLAARAEQGFEAVLRDYADCPRLMKDSDPRTLGQEAEQELYELRYLRVGKLAPEVEGEDVDGRRFKLSDYRGKVVMIDFWGDW